MAVSGDSGGRCGSKRRARLAVRGSKAFLRSYFRRPTRGCCATMEVASLMSSAIYTWSAISRRSCTTEARPARSCNVLGLPMPNSLRMIRPKLCAAAAIK